MLRVEYVFTVALVFCTITMPFFGIGDGKGAFGEHVEKCFLGITVVLESAVIVKVVACQVGEYASREVQTSDTVLVDGMAAAFHEYVFASCFYHFG